MTMVDDHIIAPLTEGFGQLQQWLFEAVVQPALFALGMGNLLEDAFGATGWLLVGVIQLLLMVAVIGPSAVAIVRSPSARKRRCSSRPLGVRKARSPFTTGLERLSIRSGPMRGGYP